MAPPAQVPQQDILQLTLYRFHGISSARPKLWNALLVVHKDSLELTSKVCASFIPLPPPPDTAFTSSGKPMRCASPISLWCTCVCVEWGDEHIDEHTEIREEQECQ